MRISKQFTFEASHVLPKHPGKCSRLHGHSWKLEVVVEGPVDEETGFVLDYGRLKGLVDDVVISRLDHTHLGYGIAKYLDMTGREVYNINDCYFGQQFYPSSENLCRAIFKLLKPLIPELRKEVQLAEVSIDETCTSKATWRKDDE